MNTNKTELPSYVASQMKLWRKGEIFFPKTYIKFHEKLARKSLENLENNGIKIHKTWMEGDGWLDGMRVLYLIVELKNGDLKKLHWMDSNQDWFQALSGGGWGVFEIPAK